MQKNGPAPAAVAALPQAQKAVPQQRNPCQAVRFLIPAETLSRWEEYFSGKRPESSFFLKNTFKHTCLKGKKKTHPWSTS